MKYFLSPLTHVIDYEKHKEIFVFDEKGEFETFDEKIIQFMKKKKNFIRSEENKPTTQMHCKKCDFETDNKGLLMAHYREHKKDGD
jgi:hypothetical protein